MGARKLSSQDKAAIILLALGEETAGQLVSGMSRDEVRRIGTALARLGRVEPALVDEVCAEFHDQLMSGKSTLVGNALSARRLMTHALGGEAPELDQMLDLATPALVDAIDALAAKHLADHLRLEHPQTVALVLAHADARKAGETLKLLPESIRTDLIQRIARLGPVDPEILHELEASLRQAAEKLGPAKVQTPGGAEKVAELLAGLDSSSADALLQRLEETDPDLAVQVRERLFKFTDLVKIDVAGIQELLKQVPAQTLRLALKAAPAAVAAHLYGCMSHRAAALIQEDLAALPKMRLSEVETAQRQMTQLARKLAEEGRITIRGKDEVYV